MTKFIYRLTSLLVLVCSTQALLATGSKMNNNKPEGTYVEIPYEYVKGKIIISAIVEGIKGRYIYDTGATSCITHARYIECGEKETGETKIRDAHKQISTLKHVFLNTIQFGDCEFTNIQALILDKGNPIECFDVDGIIGNNTFINHVVRIDETRKVLIITDRIDQFNIKPEYGLPMRPGMKNQTFIEIGLNRIMKEPVMFDSGSSAFYALNEPTYKQVQDFGMMEKLSTGHGATGIGINGKEQVAVKYKIKIPQMNIGKGLFKNVITTTMNGPSSRIGTKLLKYGIVTIDYPNGMFYFEPNDSTAIDLNYKDWNAAITVAKDHLAIGLVWESMQGILKGGEKVIEINGQRIGKIDFCDALTKPVSFKMDGEKATIIIIDSTGKEKKVEIWKE